MVNENSSSGAFDQDAPDGQDLAVRSGRRDTVVALCALATSMLFVLAIVFGTDSDGHFSAGFGGAWSVTSETVHSAGASLEVAERDRVWMLTYQQMSFIERLQRRYVWGEVGVVHTDLEAGSAIAPDEAISHSAEHAWQAALAAVAVYPDVEHQVVVGDDRAGGFGLLAGDQVLAVDGHAVTTINDANAAFAAWVERARQCLRCGIDLVVDVNRDGVRHSVRIPSAAATRVFILDNDDPELVAAGLPSEIVFPYMGPDPAIVFAPEGGPGAPELDGVDFGKVTGPSGGLAFALVYASDLAGGGLSGGRAVAATGTIDDEGRVGSVAGLAEKLAAASEAGVDVVFVPAGNAGQLAAIEDRPETVVAVETLRDALDWLCEHGGSRESCARLAPR